MHPSLRLLSTVLSATILALLLSACGFDAADPLGSQTYALLGDDVWLDGNMNGVQDPGEPLVEGVAVSLYRCDPSDGSLTHLATNTTVQEPAGNHGYVFAGVATTLFEPGEVDRYGGSVPCFVIEVELPDGYAFTGRDAGGNDLLDSDVDPATGRTDPIVPTRTGTDYSWDVGIYPVQSSVDGCTPGYWQNLRQHADDWTGYSPSQLVSSVFAADGDLGAKTLHDVIDARGRMTPAEQLVRHATAGLLNYAHPEVAYALPGGPARLIADVDAALASGDRATIVDLKDVLDAANNSGCPL